MPADLIHYVHAPGYRPEYNYLYAIIVNYYNVKYGYAYPSEWKISRAYGKGIQTVRTHLRALESYGLIKIIKPTGNKRYIPYKPLTKEKLFEKCPDARENYLKSIQAEDAEKERGGRK
ncbi:helix-turn-helix domain-containing protein [Oceanobacillus kimchii]|uniref:helix-turn-helix domain-containing protein n=1 Tax=Oceanobacillus kimchii TaxID=746691 RepID=UPI003B01F8C2